MTEADKRGVPLYVNNDFLQLSKLISRCVRNAGGLGRL